MTDRAKADGLFDSAKALMEAGDFVHACPRLSESESLDPQVGTALNLAYCYEKLGQTATAWSTWLQAAAAAAAKGDHEREKFATARSNALQPLLLRITIAVAPQPARESVELTLNQTPLPRTGWGLPIPVDPGEYELRATAPGYVAWAERFVVAKDRIPTIFVPELQPLQSPTAPPAAIPASPFHDEARISPLVWGTGGIALAALGVSGAFGIAALVNREDSYSNRNCVHGICNTVGRDDRARAQTDLNVADVGLAIGAVAGLACAAIYFATHRSHRAGGAVAWTAGVAGVSPDGGGAFLARSW